MKRKFFITTILFGFLFLLLNPPNQAFAGFDLATIDLEILDIQATQLGGPALVQIDYSLTNNGDTPIRFAGKEVLDLRSFDPQRYQFEVRRQAPSFDTTFEYLTTSNLELKYPELDVGQECKKVDFTLDPQESVESTICFEVLRGDLHKSILETEIQYYLVLSNRNANSCPFCKQILLNDYARDVEKTRDYENIISDLREAYSISQFPGIKESLIESNNEFSNIKNVEELINQRDSDWTRVEWDIVTPFMDELINNDNSQVLREIIQEDLESELPFGFAEIILTNSYGANIAQSGKTTDYKQSDEAWWKEAKENGVFVTQEYDDSADVYALDVAFRISDDENFLGVVKGVFNINHLLVSENTYFPNHLLQRETFFDESGKCIFFKEYYKNLIEKSKGLCDEMGNIEKVWHFDLQGNENYVIDYKRDGEGNIINKIKTINFYQGGLLHTLTQEHLICDELQHFIDYLFGYDSEGRLNKVTEITDHYNGECKPIKTAVLTFEIDADGRWKKAPMVFN